MCGDSPQECFEELELIVGNPTGERHYTKQIDAGHGELVAAVLENHALKLETESNDARTDQRPV